MLVLTRKIGETVHISTDIIVTLLEVKGKRIRIGIDAPTEVPIARGELLCPEATPSRGAKDRCEET